MPHLAIQRPDGDKRLKLEDQPITIGRARENIVVISHKHVSRRHCVIERHDDTFQLRDLGSLSGTLVNGKSVSIVSLSDNDKIQIGPFELWFYDSEPTEDMPAQSADSVSSPELEEPPTGMDIDPRSITLLDDSGLMPALEDAAVDATPSPETKVIPVPTPPPVPPPTPAIDTKALDALRAEHENVTSRLHDRIDVLEQKHVSAQAANQDYAARIDSLTTTLEAKEKELQTLQGDLEQGRAKLNEKVDALSALRDSQEAELKKLAQAKQELESKAAGFTEQIARQDGEIKRVTEAAAEEKQTL
ncbi:MAG: FHA domain-containing protein, partial [Planctomycetes bacterium]|nr:FHA domain-containing protein [Planctomycetota bacterium]